ncbi:ras guanine nucleotide exchange factor domain-containing protein, partial [Cunninghamella echinulata]
LPNENNKVKSEVDQQLNNTDSMKQPVSNIQKPVNTIYKIDVNEPLTWNILSAHIAKAINELSTAAKNNQSDQFGELASIVINTIRQMLLSSGTIDKDSPHLKANTLLRDHHRVMMASMSKVFLTSILSSGTGGENINKLLSETNDLLVAVRHFVGTCQIIPLSVKHVDPRILNNESEEYKQIQQQKKSNQPSSSSSAQTKYALQHDLSDNIDLFGTNMHESVDAILTDVKNGRSNQTTTAIMTDTMRVQFGAKLFTQFRNLSSQTGQFLGLVDDIDFKSFKDSPLLNELQYDKQALSDGLGKLFCHLQQLTGNHLPFNQILDRVEQAAKEIHIPISNICECIGVMVYEYELAKQKSVDTVKNKPSTSTSSSLSQPKLTLTTTTAAATTTAIPEEKEEVDEKKNKSENVKVDNDINVNTTSNEEGNNDDDDDNTTVQNDSIFSGDSTIPSLRKSSQTKLALSSPLLDDNQNSSDSLATAANKNKDNNNNSDNINNTKISTTTAIVEHPGARESGISDATTLNQADVDTKKSSHKLKKFFGDDVPSTTDIAGSNPTNVDRPAYLSYDYDLSDISFNMEGNVKGGTLPALVERLTLHDYLDMNFNNTFLLTYRSFCTSMELLDLLEGRYNLSPPPELTETELEIWKQKKLKLVRLQVYYNEEDYVILDRLMTFTDTTIRSTLSFSTDQLERLIQKRMESGDDTDPGLKKLVWTPQQIPDPILPHPTELARQLTLIDFKMYSSIRPIECLDKAWSRETSDDSAPVSVNIRASIEYCNQVTSWNDVKKRSNLIKFWVQVAEKCRELNNFNTCMAVLSAFDNSSVGRLKRTWEMVGARTNQILSHIRKIMGANRNFSEYRQLIHSVNPPCIPFLGIYLQDLTFIEDGNSNIITKSKDLINFAKREKTAEVIREIQQYQTLFYKLKPVEEIQEFIRNHLQSTRDEDQLYKESLKLEPREREDEKITRLLQESGFL